MKILNFGSINIDHVYRVENFVRPGETISAESYSRFRGGKGLNQSVALARAGAKVFHAGLVGPDAENIVEFMKETGIDCSCVECDQEQVTGHAVIQVTDAGENSIVLYGGTNRNIPLSLIPKAVGCVSKGDILLLQNEISRMPEIMTAAKQVGLRIFFNPAPMNDAVLQYPLETVDTFIVNEIEGAGLAGVKGTPENVLLALSEKYPKANILLTLGAEGAVYRSNSGETIRVPACKVEHVVDTTAAGDTFIGYFISGLAKGLPVKECLTLAAKASAFCVSRPGASDSIPRLEEL